MRKNGFLISQKVTLQSESTILKQKKEGKGSGGSCLAAAQWQQKRVSGGIVSVAAVAVLAAQWQRW